MNALHSRTPLMQRSMQFRDGVWSKAVLDVDEAMIFSIVIAAAAMVIVIAMSPLTSLLAIIFWRLPSTLIMIFIPTIALSQIKSVCDGQSS